MSYCLHDHQGKAALLQDALRRDGHNQTTAERADLTLIDIDDPSATPRLRLAQASRGPVILYPHGALSTYHGNYQPFPVDIQLVHGDGLRDLIAGLELSRDVRTIGWSYSPSVEFNPPERVNRVLFGPIHPYGSGQLGDVYRRKNAQVFAALSELDVELTVQMFRTPRENGLPHTHSARLHASSLRLDWSEIDRADLVVAEGTLACLALARGKPVVMFGQSIPPDDEHNRPLCGPVVPTPFYPIDFDDGPLDDLFAAAVSGTGQDWRDLFVGGPFDETAFLDAVTREAVAA